MKKIIVSVAILIVGILIGKFVLSNTPDATSSSHKNETKEEHWTCSMHPQIDMPEFGSCPICGMDLIPKTNDNDGLASNSFKMTKNAMALANIETIVIGNSTHQSSNTNTLKLSGKIMTNDKATAIQTAHFGGRIELLKYKSIGEYVKRGSLVASVYSPELVTAQNEFIEAILFLSILFFLSLIKSFQCTEKFTPLLGILQSIPYFLLLLRVLEFITTLPFLFHSA
jgi:Cu(I)/Ag(I) efflux system membrane fusion protein